MMIKRGIIGERDKILECSAKRPTFAWPEVRIDRSPPSTRLTDVISLMISSLFGERAFISDDIVCRYYT